MRGRTSEKFKYNENYYEEVDALYRDWRRSAWDDSLAAKPPQEDATQIGPTGWVEVWDASGTPIVQIDGDGMVWAHATTHENGGSDEIDVTDLSGLLADAQTPLAHATSHQDAGTDEINLSGLSGIPAELQAHLDDLVASHAASAVSIVDAGAYFTGTEVEAALQELGAAVAAAITDHGGLTGLGDDDHPQYVTHTEADAAYQPLDADLTAIAALATTAFGRAFLTETDAASTRATLDLEPDTDFPSLTTFNNHLSDATDAHDASAISVLDTAANFTGTDVEAVLAELQDNIDAVSAGSLPDHTHAATGSGANGGGATLRPTTIEIPDAGTLNFGTIPDVTLSRGAADRLDLATGDSLRLSTSGQLQFGSDTKLGRNGADDLALFAGDSLTLLGGYLNLDDSYSMRIWGLTTDANPKATYAYDGIRFGAGGASALDSALLRIGGNVLQVGDGTLGRLSANTFTSQYGMSTDAGAGYLYDEQTYTWGAAVLIGASDVEPDTSFRVTYPGNAYMSGKTAVLHVYIDLSNTWGSATTEFNVSLTDTSGGRYTFARTNAPTAGVWYHTHTSAVIAIPADSALTFRMLVRRPAGNSNFTGYSHATAAYVSRIGYAVIGYY